MPQRTEVLLVYITALAQGLALVTFPAASSIFTSPDGYGFSASRYGTDVYPPGYSGHPRFQLWAGTGRIAGPSSVSCRQV